MHKLKEMLESELHAVVENGKLDYESLDTVGKVLDAIKDIETICAMRPEKHESMAGELEALAKDADSMDRDEVKEKLTRLMTRY